MNAPAEEGAKQGEFVNFDSGRESRVDLAPEEAGRKCLCEEAPMVLLGVGQAQFGLARRSTEGLEVVMVGSPM